MRISDWSSDVCSSDLAAAGDEAETQMNAFEARAVDEYLAQRTRQRQLVDTGAVELEGDGGFGLAAFAGLEEIRAEGLLRQVTVLPDDRSEERRVGKECGSTCKSRG